MEKKILIIEDDHTIRMNLCELLEESGFKIFTAATGREGLKSAKENLPDLIISDIMLPDIDGFEIIEEANKTKSLSVIPFIFLTAKSEIQDMRKGMLKGAADYIIKPYDAVEILKVIELRLKKSEDLKEHFSTKKKNESKPLNHDDKIVVQVNGKPVFVKLNQIICITSENVYTNIYLKDSKPLLVRKSMKEWEEILPQNLFIRIHRSTIINSDHIQKIEKWFNRGYKVFMNHSTQSFIISQRYALNLKEKMI